MAAYAPISDVAVDSFRWLHGQGTGPTFDLLAGERPVGQLKWVKAHGSLAEFEGADVHWTLKRSGFLYPRVSSRAHGSETDRARLSALVGTHTIELAGGARYSVRRTGLLVPGWEVRNAQGQKVLDFESVPEGRRLAGGLVSVAPAARALPDLLDVLVVTWYFIVLAWFEDEAAAVAADVIASLSGAAS